MYSMLFNALWLNVTGLLAQTDSATKAADNAATQVGIQWILAYVVAAAVLIVPYWFGYVLADWLRVKTHGWRIGTILSSLACAGAIVGFQWPPKLGVDLKGGYNFVYSYDEAVLESLAFNAADRDARKDMTIETLKKRLNPDGLREIVIRPYGVKEGVEIIVPETDPAAVAKTKRMVTEAGYLEFVIMSAQGNPEYDLAREQAEQAPNGKVKLVKRGDEEVAMWKKIGREPREVEGIQPFKPDLSPWMLFRDGDTGKLVQMPPQLFQGGGHLSLARAFSAAGVTNPEVLVKLDPDKNARVNGGDLRASQTRFQGDGRPYVYFAVADSASGKMGELTRTNDEKQLAIVLDQRLLSHATIRDTIMSEGQITGSFTVQEVNDIVEILRAGSMPAPLEKVPRTETSVDPTLGAESIRSGAVAIGVSLFAVLAFVLVYYRFSGAVACFALLANLLITLAIMILFGAPFTLPGLAGMVLTVGMSVDSNVLIFERMREEMERGAGLRLAIRNGFERAFTTILDSNLTTLLTAIVLYFVGTDQLVGFAVTLILGIIVSMYTAIFCARTIFDIAERNGWIKDLSMMKFATKTDIDFVGYQWFAIIGSALLIGIGLFAGVSRGAGLFGIDFTGGSAIDIALKQPMDYGAVRSRVEKALDGLVDEQGKPIGWSLGAVTLGGAAPNEVTRYKLTSAVQGDKAVAEVEGRLEKEFVDGGKSLLRKIKFRAKFADDGAAPAPTGQGSRRVNGPERYFAAFQGDATSEAAPATTSESAPTTDAAPPETPAPSGDTPASEPPASEAAPDAPAVPDAPASESDPPVAVPTTRREAKPAEAVSTGFEIELNDDLDQGEGIDADALIARFETASEAVMGERLAATVKPLDGNIEKKSGRSVRWKVELPVDETKSKAIVDALSQELDGKTVWPSSSVIGSQVAKSTKVNAVLAMVISLIGIVAYVWFRFHQFSWGLAAVAALIHDVLFMFAAIAVSSYLAGPLGVLGVEDFKIDLTMVAAFLTLIGYSLNDTIVIFDRLREIKGRLPDVNRKIVNDSINQTLSRTLLTFLTTFMVVFILYVWGGQGIHGFAYAMLVGTAVGCYSTVFIAAPVLLALVKTSDEKPSRKPA